jgi:hypothetical protein
MEGRCGNECGKLRDRAYRNNNSPNRGFLLELGLFFFGYRQVPALLLREFS